MRIALFATCLADTMFPAAAKATVQLLERLGHEVAFPAQQTCCGQMHINTGYQKDALPLVRRHVRTFAPYDVVVAPSGSCVGSVRHQHAMVARHFDDEGLAARADDVASRTYELSELLVDVLKVEDVGAYYPHRVTYHPTCHSLRVLRVGDKPLRLLRNVRGLELVDLPAAEQCCGFGGTFAIKNADTSTAMLADKMRHVLDTGADVCTAGDSSCLMHIGGGLSRLRTGVRTVHLAEILASTESGPAGVASGSRGIAPLEVVVEDTKNDHGFASSFSAPSTTTGAIPWALPATRLKEDTA
jgi:L-lactate dehydrogenase complex protein LldE